MLRADLRLEVVMKVILVPREIFPERKKTHKKRKRLKTEECLLCLFLYSF